MRLVLVIALSVACSQAHDKPSPPAPPVPPRDAAADDAPIDAAPPPDAPPPMRTEDCRRSPRCRELGECVAEGGTCVAPADTACKHLAMCTEGGECVSDGRRCTAANEAACRRAPDCRRKGTCHLAAAHCEADDDSCAVSEGCKLRGECDVVHDARLDRSVCGKK